MKLSTGHVVAATRGQILVSGDDRPHSGVSIDSRTVRAGELFFAIVGPRHDGHEFVGQAFASGASGVVVSDRTAVSAVPEGRCAVLVADTTRALGDLAADVRKGRDSLVMAITGSVGKTTTKDLAALLLAGHLPTHASPGNLNNHYGLPLALLAQPEETRVLVLEMGISTPGEMDRLVEIAAPEHGLVTRISPAHVGNFASLEELADEKMKLARGCRVAHLNADDPLQVARSGHLEDVRTFGSAARGPGSLRLIALADRGLEGSILTAERDGERIEIPCPLPGAHQARNMLAAASLALEVGVPPAVVALQARDAEPAPHRGEVLQRCGATVVDDTYNANPAAMRAAIDLLTATATRGRRILVAGDMLELGSESSREHRSLGDHAAEAGVDVLVGVGPESLAAVEAARARGVAGVHVPDAQSAGDWLRDELAEGDLVVVKGSRGIGLERAIAALDGGRCRA